MMGAKEWVRVEVFADKVAFTDFSEEGEKQCFFEDLPMDIKGKIAVLRLLEPGDALPNMGVRIANNVFFVII